MEADGFQDLALGDAAELGAITDRGVRLWIRAPERERVAARLEVTGQPPVGVILTPTAATDWTATGEIVLPHPAPDQPFICRVGDHRLVGRLAPAVDSHPEVVFGFGSCNRPFGLDTAGRVQVLPVAGIYRAMCAELLAAGARFCLLIGDQVYADALPPISILDQVPGDAATPPPFDEALAAYRRVTRGFLGQTDFRALREAIPTLCMWDDHDIFNDWGSRLTESPRDRLLFAAASRVFCEYQRGRNPGGEIGPPPYQFTIRHGTAGFVVLDLRGKRDYQAGRLLGEEQWVWLQDYLTGAEARDLHTLFVVATVPVAHVSRWLVEIVERLPTPRADDARDRWCSRAFRQSRDDLLTALLDWQTAKPHRQVILLSGDVHAASAFTIRRRGGPGRIVQLTSSALTTPSTWSERSLNQLTTWWPNLLEPRFRFARHFVDASRNNFGLVRAVPLADGGHRVECVVRGWEPRQRTLVTIGQVATEPDR